MLDTSRQLEPDDDDDDAEFEAMARSALFVTIAGAVVGFALGVGGGLWLTL